MKVRENILIEKNVLEKAYELGLKVSKCCDSALKLYISAIATANSQIELDISATFGCLSRQEVRPPGFEPGSSAWQADVLAKLDYGRVYETVYF